MYNVNFVLANKVFATRVLKITMSFVWRLFNIVVLKFDGEIASGLIDWLYRYFKNSTKDNDIDILKLLKVFMYK